MNRLLCTVFILGFSILSIAGCDKRGDPPEPEIKKDRVLAAGNFAIGEKPDDFELPTKEGEPIRLYDLIDGDTYVAVVWHSPSCPCARNCLLAISNKLSGENYDDLEIVGIISDTIQDYEWYQADLAAQVDEGIINFPIVYDKDQSVQQAYGAERTPTVWLLDKDGKIQFWGAPENVLERTEDGYRFLMKEALDHLRAGEPIPIKTFKPIGCPIMLEEA